MGNKETISIFEYLSPGGSDGEESTCNARDLALIPGSGRSPGEGNGNPLQYSHLENPMDREAWRATVHGVANSRLSTHAHTHTHQLFEMQWLDFLPIPESHTEQEALRSPHSLFLGLVPAQCLVAGSWGLAGFVAVGWQAWWAAAVAGWWWLSEKLDWSVLEQPTKKGSVSGTTKINFTASQFSWNLLDLGD